MAGVDRLRGTSAIDRPMPSQGQRSIATLEARPVCGTGVATPRNHQPVAAGNGRSIKSENARNWVPEE
ncbi:hypothetical protein GCM10010172_60850 [Paractinoplanes ferrugineus]|uniref:Uncharacterized protein n=1 Tax=Paractinoplanes ferrugineus TaxID=113564 RepID=A0A919J769_9ACTN|nr:hypothetical protein Afe05nite_64270 [Actinoplanes ferrugineus]